MDRFPARHFGSSVDPAVCSALPVWNTAAFPWNIPAASVQAREGTGNLPFGSVQVKSRVRYGAANPAAFCRM